MKFLVIATILTALTMPSCKKKKNFPSASLPDMLAITNPGGYKIDKDVSIKGHGRASGCQQSEIISSRYLRVTSQI